MNFKLIDTVLNGRLCLQKGSLAILDDLPSSAYAFIWNRGFPMTIEVNFIPIQLPTHSIFSVSPGQKVLIPDSENDFLVIQFNREFYCIQDHDHEVSCNGILFNGALLAPVLVLNQSEQRSFGILLEVMMEEFGQQDDVQLEMLRTMLKRFIIKCTRLAKQQFAEQASSVSEFDLVRNFSMLVEKNFRQMHKVNEYAALLNKSSKTLSNAFNTLGEKTPLQIIHERIILEAKKLLIYTDKSAKEIAFELGFNDPVQFARLFKNETGCAPVEFKKAGVYSQTGIIVKH